MYIHFSQGQVSGKASWVKSTDFLLDDGTGTCKQNWLDFKHTKYIAVLGRYCIHYLHVCYRKRQVYWDRCNILWTTSCDGFWFQERALSKLFLPTLAFSCPTTSCKLISQDNMSWYWASIYSVEYVISICTGKRQKSELYHQNSEILCEDSGIALERKK